MLTHPPCAPCLLLAAAAAAAGGAGGGQHFDLSTGAGAAGEHAGAYVQAIWLAGFAVASGVVFLRWKLSLTTLSACVCMLQQPSTVSDFLVSLPSLHLLPMQRPTQHSMRGRTPSTKKPLQQVCLLHRTPAAPYSNLLFLPSSIRRPTCSQQPHPCFLPGTSPGSFAAQSAACRAAKQPPFFSAWVLTGQLTEARRRCALASTSLSTSRSWSTLVSCCLPFDACSRRCPCSWRCACSRRRAWRRSCCRRR